jgi:hypothetical protein
LSFPDPAEDVAIESRLALRLTEEITELDERIGALMGQLDLGGILTSVPGVGVINGAAISAGSATRRGSVPCCGPRLLRAGVLAGLLRCVRAARRTDQTRRCRAPRGAAPGRSAGPTARPHPRGEVPTAHGRRRQAPHVRRLPNRHGPLTRIMACWPGRHPPPAPRPRRQHYHPRRSPRDHRRPVHRTPQAFTPAGPLRRNGAGETRSRQALHRPARPPPTLRPSERLDIG